MTHADGDRLTHVRFCRRPALGVLAFLIAFASAAPRATGLGGDGSLSADERAWVAAIPVTSGPVGNPSGAFDTRYTIAPSTAENAPFNAPRVLHSSAFNLPNGGAETSIDVDAIFPIAPQALLREITDYDDYERISYRTDFSTDRSSTQDAMGYHNHVLRISATFLGIGRSYLFSMNSFGTTTSDGRYEIQWNLASSYQETLDAVYGSWLVAPVTYNGRPAAYIRYFNRVDFHAAPPVPLPILERISTSDYLRLLSDTDRAAREDWGGGQDSSGTDSPAGSALASNAVGGR